MGDESQTSDSEAQELKPKRLSWALAEWFSILTGLSFVLSATIQSIIFAAQNLDFTAIASAEDVVMGGLRLFTLALPSLLFILPAIGSMAILRAEDAGARRWSVERYVRVIVTAPLLLGVFIFVIGVSPSFSSPGAFIQEFALSNGILITSAAAMFLIFLATSDAAPSRIYDEFLHSLKSYLFLSMIAAIFTVAILQSIIRPELGFAFVDQARLPLPCRATSSGTHHEIRWIGSRAMVLQCGETWFVITPQEDSALLRVR